MVNPKVTIIILNFNGLDDTKKCLKSLIKSSYDNFEAIVVDNGSKKNEAKQLKSIFLDKRINFLRFQKNLGFSGGNNKALKIVKTKYVVLLNNDTTVSKNWLKPLIEAMEKDKSIAVVQPKILWMENKKYFDYAGACGGFIDIFGYPFTRGRIFDTMEKDEGQYDDACEIFWASGAAMAISTGVLRKVGYFDELFFNYMEEIDLCFRIHQAGYKILSEPKSKVYHKVAGSASKNPFKKRFWEHRNNILLILKNYPFWLLLIVMPIRILLEFVSIVFYLSQGRFDFAKSVLISQFSLFLISPKIMRRRIKGKKLINLKRTYKGSLVYSYFILGNKKYDSYKINKIKKDTITYLIWNTKNCGGNRVIFEHINRLRKRGHNIKVISVFGKQASWMSLDIKITSFFSFKVFEKKDILVATFWPTVFLASLMRAKRKIHFVQAWEEDFYRNRCLRILAKLSYKFPYEKIVISGFLRKKIRKISNSNITKIKNSIFNKDDIIKNKIKNMNIKHKGEIKILSVVPWYSYYKGVDLLSQSIKKIKLQNNNYKFTLVSLEKKSYDNIFDRFISNPDRKKLLNLYSKHNCLLATSRSEGFFLPGLEAMANGCPLITTQNGGIGEYATNKKNSIIVKNIESIWKKDVIGNLMNDKNLLNKIIKNGYLTAGKYVWEEVIYGLERVYFKR